MPTRHCPHCYAVLELADNYKVVCENPQCRRTIYLYTNADKKYLRREHIADPDLETEPT